MQKNYYAIIPATVRYDKTLKANSKLLYGEITALANEKGYCWANNNYFAELYGVSKETVSRWISDLEKRGHITTKLIYKENTKQVKERRVYIGNLNQKSIGIDEKVKGSCQEHQEPVDEKINTPIDEKVKENTTSFNTTVNNTKNTTTTTTEEKESSRGSSEIKKPSNENKGPAIDKNLSLVAKEYEQCGFGTIDMRTKELLEDLLEQYSTEWIVQAFSVCVEANKRTIKYAKGILNNWKTEGGMKLGGKADGRSSQGNRESEEEVDCEGDRLYRRAVEKFKPRPIEDHEIDF